MKKRFFRGLVTLAGLVLAVVLLCLPAFAACEHTYENNICTQCGYAAGKVGSIGTWEFDPDSGTLTISSSGAMPNYSTTSSIAPRRALADQIEHIVVEAGITKLGNYCFYNLTAATDVTIHDSVKTLGTGVFYLCANLEEAAIRQGVTAIPAYAFRECKALTKVVLPEGITSVGNYAFYKCAELEGLAIGLVQLIQHSFAIAIAGIKGLGSYVGIQPLCNILYVSTPLHQ